MASIYENLNTLEQVKSDIKSALENRGLSLNNVPFTEYGEQIENMPVGEYLDAELTEQTNLLNDLHNQVDLLGERENKLAQVVDGTITELTASDLAGATKIRDHAFQNSTELTSIVIPNGVTAINALAFYNCTNLINIEIPNSVTTIGNEGFSRCLKLTSITIPASVTSLGSYAFEGCNVLSSVVFDENSQLGSIGQRVFQSCPLTNIKIPASVTSIDVGAFYGCRQATNLVFEHGSQLKYIARDVFSGCISLSGDVRIPATVTGIGESAFFSCKFDSVVFEEDSKLTGIGPYAFQYCSNLKKITIPSGVASISSLAFYGCTNLTEMTILATTPPNLSATSSISSTTTTIYIPKGTLSAYQSATNWSAFSDKFVELEA